MSEQTVTLESLQKRIEQLEAQVEDCRLAHLDNHEAFRSFAQRLNEYQGQLGREGTALADRLVARMFGDLNTAFETAIESINRTLEATRKAYTPESIAEKVQPSQIAEALAGKVLVTRPAGRHETAVAVRQATSAELRNS